ncbi:esterase-like activity of phytase family protein [Gordonia sp. X0973]|uniref:esterase-like activity of phytase family protein n=1 Tax=Gordonia sp. X0973 TaxID=2742602 RepID=UPI000F51D27B|nr:esterase-like activity of phytase family protein [Gordonia sp. X0973]QKT07442.1 esterase-like activity of phytase family protein [Gordonia sp. X0973]
MPLKSSHLSVVVALILVGLGYRAAPAAAVPPGACSPSVVAVGYSDALDKRDAYGDRIGGLSALAHDPGGNRYLALPDHVRSTALVWPLTGVDELPVARPRVAGPPIRLRGRDGLPLPGRADDEGLAVLSDGSLAVSSENGPRVTVFGGNGQWRQDVAIPAPFATAPTGGAVPNGSLEGLTATPSGDRLIAAMEKPLLGDDQRTLRFLDYHRGRDGRFVFSRELLYRPGPGMRVADIAAYRDDRIVVLEAAFVPGRGNSAVLTTAVVGPAGGTVSPRRLHRRFLADLARCPTLGARSREPQVDPLLDNYEGIAVVSAPGGYRIHLISDDNYSPRQTTRLLGLWAQLPD